MTQGPRVFPERNLLQYIPYTRCGHSPQAQREYPSLKQTTVLEENKNSRVRLERDTESHPMAFRYRDEDITKTQKMDPQT